MEIVIGSPKFLLSKDHIVNLHFFKSLRNKKLYILVYSWKYTYSKDIYISDKYPKVM